MALLNLGCLLGLLLILPYSNAQLTGITVEGDDGDVIYINAPASSCGLYIYVSNDNDFEVNVTVVGENGSQSDPVPARSTLVPIPLTIDIPSGVPSLTVNVTVTLYENIPNSTLFIDDFYSNTTNITTTAATPQVKVQYFVKEMTLVDYVPLQGVSVSGNTSVITMANCSVTASISAGTRPKFTFTVTYQNESDPSSDYPGNVTEVPHSVKDQIVFFIPKNEGNYTVSVNVTCPCDDSVVKTFIVSASYPVGPFYVDPTFEITSNRGHTSTFYPKELIGFALKPNGTSITKKQVTCTLNWGDGTANLTEANIKLSPDKKTGFIYVRNHSYENIGLYKASVYCLSKDSNANNIAHYNIISPAGDTGAIMANTLVPFADDTSRGNGTVIITHKYLRGNYTDLIITVYFGDNTTNVSFPFMHPNISYNHTYNAKGNYSIDVYFQAFGQKNSTKVTLRVGLILDFFQEKYRRLIRVNEPTVFKLVRVMSNETYNASFQMNPGNDQKTFDFNVRTVKTETIYSDVGPNQVTAVVDYGGVLEAATYDFETYVPCISTVDLFDLTYREMDTPLKVWLSTIPTLSARAERTISCNSSDKFLIEWKLLKLVTSTTTNNWTSVSLPTQNESAIAFDFSHVIKDIGMYEIMINMSVIGRKEKESDIMFMNVTFPPVEAGLLGGFFRQSKLGNKIILNAGSYSRDPADKNYKLTFSWACYKLNSRDDIPRYTQPYNSDTSYRSLPNCTNSKMTSADEINFDASGFQVKDLLLIEVTAQKNDRFDVATQAIELLANEPPNVIIECVWNCKKKLLTSERTVLKSVIICLSCTEKDRLEAQYQWSIYKYNNEPTNPILDDITASSWSRSQIKSAPNSTGFDSEEGLWEEGATYSIVLKVTFTSLPEATAMHVVFTNLAPYSGKCSVEPKAGKATETMFTFKFPGWKDESIRRARNASLDSNFGLQYEIYQDTLLGKQLVYVGDEISAGTFLSECGADNRSCEVTVNVIDIYREKVSCNLTVFVSPNFNMYAPGNPGGNDSVDGVLSVMERRMNSSLDLKDPMKIAQRAAALSNLITSVDNTVSGSVQTTTANPTSDRDTSTARSTLGETANKYVDAIGSVIDDITIKSPGQVQILANSMVVATNNTNFMTTSSMAKASVALTKLTDVMRKSDDNKVDFSLPDLRPCLAGVIDLIHNIIHAGTQVLGTLCLKENIIKDDNADEDFIKMTQELCRRAQSVQLQQAVSIAGNISSAWDDVFTRALTLENPEGRYETKTPSYKMAVQKGTLAEIMNSSMFNKPLGFTFDDAQVDSESLTTIHLQAANSLNIYYEGLNSEYVKTVVTASAVAENGTKLKLTNPTVFHETADSNCSVEENFEIQPAKFIAEDASQMFYHEINYPETFLHLCFKVRPTNPAITYTLYARMDKEPSDIIYDHKKPLTKEMLQSCGEVCFPPGTFTQTGLLYIGLKPEQGYPTRQTTGRKKRDAIDPTLQSPYHFAVTVAQCMSFNKTMRVWDTNVCKMTKSNGSIICTCNDDTEIINGLSFSFVPNTIHFGTVFSKFDIKGQGLLIGVLLGIYLIFTIICLWAHYKDRKGVLQWGVFPLADNYADDNYYYLLTVHTGLRKSAGTKSKVSFCLYGVEDETGVRILSDGVKEGFPTGSVSNFVMACPSTLGDLQCLRIWHDNSGRGEEATWYLDRVDVVDIQTGRANFFLCEEWLTPEGNSVEKMIEVTSIEDLETLRSLFFSNTKQHITDEHMWVSLFIRPQRSRFSRVERAGCCLAFLLLAMITSAMFYRGAPDAGRMRPKVDFEIGPLKISLQQIYYSLASAVITAIPMMFVMAIFKRARTRLESGPGCCGSKVRDTQEIYSQQVSLQGKKSRCCTFPWMAKLESQLQILEKILLIRPGATELKGTWPRTLRYFAWILIVVTIGASSFFVILYSMEWGKDITEEWLSTFFLSFLQSLFVVDPFKVLVISVMVSVLIRKANVKGMDELNLDVISHVNREYGIKQKPEIHRVYNTYMTTLSKSELKAATMKRKLHVMIRNTLKEFCIHFFYLLVVCSLCYANRSDGDHLMYNVISDALIQSTTTDTGFNSVNSSRDYINWLNSTLRPWLFPESNKMYEPNAADKKYYTEEMNLYRLGEPRIRQLRMKKEDCSYEGIKLHKCVAGYDLTNEQTRNYCLGWSPLPCTSAQSFSWSNKSWSFQSAQSIWGIPIAGSYGLYGGGGYVIAFGQNTIINIINEFKEYMWIDRQTRAIFLEFTIYCPNINHFAYVILLAEFLDTGGILPFSNIYPFTAHNPPGILGAYFQLCEIIGIIFTLVGVLYAIFIFGKKKWAAFKDLWFVVDFSAVLVGICTASMLFLRLSYTKSAIAKVKADNQKFVNFYQVVVWDASLMICLSLLIVIGCLRLLKLAGYSERTMKVYTVLSLAVKTLPSFFIFIFLILMGFAAMGFILFGRTSFYFNGYWHTVETLFTGLLGHSSFKETNVPAEDTWISIVFFCMFVGVVVILLTNFFLAVLMDLLNAASNRHCKGEDTKIFIVLWDMFLKSMGSKRDPLDRLKIDDLESEDASDDNIQLNNGIDDCMSRFGISLSKVCQDDGDQILNWASKAEAKRKQAAIFCDIELPKTKTNRSDEIFSQIVRHDC